MKALVTGGAGFIGSNLVNRLLADGWHVIVIDNLNGGKIKNFTQHEDNEKFEFYERSICDDLDDLFKEVDVVFHVAAMPRVQFSIDHPRESNEVNINGTLNVLEACRKNNVRRIVYSSSSSVYGDNDRLPLVETMSPNPMSPYALQKLAGEYYCKLYYLIHKIETVSLRYFNVFGPGQDPYENYASLIPKVMGLVSEGKSPEIRGNGEQTRDFTFVKDVVEANILAATTENKQAFGEAFNIGNGKNESINEVVKTIIGDKDIKIIYLPPVIEPKDTLADISKASRILGWEPKYNFEQAIRETIQWFGNLNS